MATLELCLCPGGRLSLSQLGDDLEEISPITDSLKNFFNDRDTGQGLLHLGLTKLQDPSSPSLLFWQGFSRRFLSAVCRVQPPDVPELQEVPSLSEEDWSELLSQAPPMEGIEYLTTEVLQLHWQSLSQALQAELSQAGVPIQQYLDRLGSDWHLSGRVCFHLAENKLHPSHPFAFMATYVPQTTRETAAQHLPLKRALQEYAGDREALLALLSPVQAASTKSPLVNQLITSGELFSPQAWSAHQAHQFLKAIPIMEASGIQVRIPNWWSRKKPSRVKASISLEAPTAFIGLGALLSFDVQLSIGDASLTLEEWEALQAQEGDLVQIKGRWVEVDRDKLNQILAHWKALKSASREGISMAEGLRLLSGVSEMAETESAEEEASSWTEVIASSGLTRILQELHDPRERDQQVDAVLGTWLQANLRPYQKKGVQWLWTLYRLGLGGLLADDMGLGKTVQLLSLLLLIRHTAAPGKRHLLVVPASLVGNWQTEANRFTPSLTTWTAHGSDLDWDAIPEVDLVVTTYANLIRRPQLQQISWDLVILDEAQAIKNPNCKQAQMAKTLQARLKIALTGTPIENRLSDLWSLFDFVLPGLLGSSKQFSLALKKTGQERYSPSYARFLAALRRLTQPYLLRRLKTDKTVISDLPNKIEMQTECFLSKEQASLYQATVMELAEKLKAAEGIQRRGLVLSYLSQLKQICNHPDQWRGVGDYPAESSGKWQRLGELCSEIAARQERVLIFTQFKSIMPPLFDFLTQLFGRPGVMLHGDTPIPERTKLVEAFQQADGPPFFLLSLRAGGTGLNLTRANHVIHFDRWWNPAVESQATDRAFRIGQKNPVTVHPFVCRGTIEEKIDALISSKKALSQEILGGENELSLTEMSNEQLLQLVTLDLDQALEESL